MGERIKSFFKWVGNNLAWEALRAVSIYLAQAIIALVGGGVILQRMPQIAVSINASLVSFGLVASDYLIPLFVVSFFIYGVVSFVSPPINLFITYVIRSDKPRLLASEGFNNLFTYAGNRIAVARIPIKNQPGRRTDKSIAYDVSAKVEYFTKDDKLILSVKCGYLSKAPIEHYFHEMGKAKGCTKLDFYAHDSYSIPLLYEIEGDDAIYAYDHRSPFKAKKLGKLPVKIHIWLSGANYNSRYPIKYFVVPNTTGTTPKGFWPQRR